MSGGGDLPVYATSKPVISTSGPAGSSSTRYRTANSRASPRYDTAGHSDDFQHEHSGENPYANIQEFVPLNHSSSLTDEFPPPSSSPLAALLNQPRLWRAPWHAQLKYKLWSAVHSVRLRHFVVPGVVLSLFLLFAIYEPHAEIRLYSRRWIHDEVDPVPPLSGCFEKAEKEGAYNVTERVWQKTSTWDVQAGVNMMKGMDCYDYSGIIGSQAWRRRPQDDMASRPVDERTVYHTYWRTDLAPFGPRQEYMLKSFFATQPLHKSRLILWSNGDLTGNSIIYNYMQRFPEAFMVKQVDIALLARGTALEGSVRLEQKDKLAWVDGDLLRLLVLWDVGGVWVDMDSLMTRSLQPLLEHEFVTQWDCYNKPYTPLNGALMHFHRQSSYLCEAFHIMATSTPPRAGSTDWGSLLYTKLWRRLVRAGIPPFKVLPWCFSDGRSCRIDNRLPDPFRKDGEGEGRWIPGPHPSSHPVSDVDLPPSAWGLAGLKNRGGNTDVGGGRVMGMEEGGLLDDVLHKVFSVHLHNQWEKNFPKGGWVDRLLLRRYEKELRRIVASSPSTGPAEGLDKRTPEIEEDEQEKTAESEAEN